MTTSAKAIKYYEAVGRRKTSTARVRIYNAKGDFTVNSKPISQYFPLPKHQKIALEPLEAIREKSHFSLSALIKGGGVASQSEALRHGISRALLEYDPEYRKKLKKLGFLKRDPRAKERRKFGLKKARKAPQWSKR